MPCFATRCIAFHGVAGPCFAVLSTAIHSNGRRFKTRRHFYFYASLPTLILAIANRLQRPSCMLLIPAQIRSDHMSISS